MEEKSWLLLKAVEHNWGLMGYGDWSEITWHIFNDGSFDIVAAFNPDFKDYKEIREMLGRNELPKPVKKKKTGKMDKEAFQNLRMQ